MRPGPGDGAGGVATFRDLFQGAAPSHLIDPKPFDWQERLALGHKLPEVVRVPTGAGKTEGAVLGWLWRRRFADDATRRATPRRLVYCLPMRVLVEQTADRCEAMLERLGLGEEIRVHTLMGGAVAKDWIAEPEADAILVGTLDQLLSRALMRGYGVSRYAWPIHFALLHNDALWILDEVQLFGEALATSSQLDGLRARLPPGALPSHTIWMSATVEPGWIATVDRPVPERVIRLGEADRRGALAPRLEAIKRLREVDTLDADAVVAAHLPGTLTLAVLNTVAAARELYGRLKRTKNLAPDLRLVHSRFRPHDRAAALGALTADVPEGGRIVVSTQVIEAGVDVSAAALLTEAAPWASLVQRFGRTNRYGEHPNGVDVVWARPAKPAPYDPEQVARAEAKLRELEGTSVGPAALEALDAPLDPPARRHTLRRRDLIGLFDTAPDLSGMDLDIGRFVRDVDELSVSVAWRDLPEARPRENEADLHRDELCPVAIGELRKVIEAERKADKGRRTYRHDPVARRRGATGHTSLGDWTQVGPGDLRPGDRLLVDVAFGHYTPEGGFDPAAKGPAAPVPVNDPLGPPESADSDVRSPGVWLSLAQHTDGVCEELEGLLTHFPGLSGTEVSALRRAARLHDWGKAHAVFQAALRRDGEGVPAEFDGALLAKRIGPGDRYTRPGFRHELASVLAYLAEGDVDPLTAYLIASHHGRVRLGARSLPTERWPEEAGRAFMLGCWQGDALPDADLGGDVTRGRRELDLSVMELGSDDGETYTDMALGLLDQLGPMRLAFLEALLRTADTRRSAAEATTPEPARA